MSGGNHRLNLFLLLCVSSLLTILLFGFAVVRRSRVSRMASLGVKPKPATPNLKIPTGYAEAPASADQSNSAPPSEEPTRSTPEKALRTVAKDIPASKSNQRGNLLYFRTDASADSLGKLAVASLDALDKISYSSELSCARVHFSAGTGVCLTRESVADGEKPGQAGLAFLFGLTSFTGYSAVVFDEQFRSVARNIKLNGLPSRVRVSPRGHLAAVTVFLSGQSYAALKFSTQTTIIDVGSGKVLADVETFSVTRNGEPFQSPDFNFWGVTFSHDENIFYATLWSTGKTYLVKCDLAKHAAEVIYEWVECPSLSPDNTRIAFKKRTGFVGGPAIWRISLLDLRTLTATPLGETRSVDDQVEWLDNDHILYALSENDKRRNIWALPVDPNGSPRLWLTGASSPAVVKSMNELP
jgi:hypothetical protein